MYLPFFSIPKKKGWNNNLSAFDEMFKRIPGTYAMIYNIIV
jgi:hypothetical protein